LPSLVVEEGKDKGLSFELKPDHALLIGRDASCDVHLSDTLASRHHCWVEYRSPKYFIRDAGSRNGTFLNGRRVGESELQAGDQVLIGETILAFQAEAPSVDPLVGREVAGYKILALLGKGGMGRVYKATQLSLDRLVAIKILSKQYANNDAFIERFRREAVSLAKLSHPNVVSVYDVGESEGSHYFSMEFMPNGSIAQQISHGRKLQPERALRMMIDVANGLTYAEEKGVVHRDIKPENMMLDASDSVKICDLGIAHTIGEGPWQNTSKGVFGSPHYIAPEQARNEQTDHRADIYSLGASFYRILSGRTLFTGTSARDLMLKHIHETPVPISQLEPALPSELCRAIDKMLSKNVADRYQSARDVVKDLEDVRKKMQEHKSVLADTRAKADRRRRKHRKTVRLLSLIFVIIFTIAGYLLYRYYGPRIMQFLNRQPRPADTGNPSE